MSRGSGARRGIRPRGWLICWRTLEDAHQLLARQLLRQRLPDAPADGKLEVDWSPYGRRCGACGHRLSLISVHACMAGAEVHCLHCTGFWPDLIVDFGSDEAPIGADDGGDG